MKFKNTLVVLMIAAFGLAVRAGATEIKDMKSSDWAFKSVQKLVDKGYLAVYDDGTFRGDQPVSRVVFASALAKLIDQIERGELAGGGVDLAELKKISDSFKNEVSDYDGRMKSLDKRLSDIESGKVVIQQDISRATVEFRDKMDSISAENQQMKKDIAALNENLGKVNASLEKERSERKKAQKAAWIGIVGAAVAGLASN